MKNIAVKYGVYALIITVIWTLIEHFLGYNTTNHETGQYARMIGSFVFWLMIIFGIAAVRKQQGNVMTFGQGFKAGSTISVIYALGVSIWYAIYGEVINTQYKPTLMAFERSKLDAVHASPDIIAAKMKEVDLSTGGSVISYVFLFIFMSISGIVIAAITSLLLKRKSRVTVDR